MQLTAVAKGRVERLFQTLQDRLVKALPLAGINDIDKANAWLPGYVEQHNQRFAVAPRQQAEMYRPWLGSAAQLASICALHHQRLLSAQLNCCFRDRFCRLSPARCRPPKPARWSTSHSTATVTESEKDSLDTTCRKLNRFLCESAAADLSD